MMDFEGSAGDDPKGAKGSRKPEPPAEQGSAERAVSRREFGAGPRPEGQNHGAPSSAEQGSGSRAASLSDASVQTSGEGVVTTPAPDLLLELVTDETTLFLMDAIRTHPFTERRPTIRFVALPEESQS